MRSAWAEVRSGSLTRGSRILLAVLAAAGSCSGDGPRALDGGARGAAPRAFRLTADAAARPASARTLADGDWVGGRLALSDGGAVTVYVSRSYADPGAPRRWADYLGGLVHGAELGRLEAYIAPPDEVLALCAARALGCYGSDTMISIGETVEGVTPEEVVAHEYGHHVALNRQNPPWRAIDHGTKRWGTGARICTRAAAGEVFPGDEALRYALNPGEAFAEAYRALVESRRGEAAFEWTLVDRSFYPDAEALERVEDDVLRPWSGATRSSARGRVGPARTWVSTLATPLDGELEVKLIVAAGTAASLQVLEQGPRVAARGLWASTTEQRATSVVCGSRSVRVRVTAPRGTRFALRFSIP